MTSIGTCSTCIKFRKECINGVMSEGDPWDGHDGGCTYWMGERCLNCKNNVKNPITPPSRSRPFCSKGIVARSEFFDHDGQCTEYAPTVRQATLEGF